MTWLVVGGGVSGLGACQLLAKRNFHVRLSESSRLSDEQRSQFKHLGVEILDGGHNISHLEDATHVVVSPGIRADHPLILNAFRNNIPVMTEVDLALETYKGQIVAVTGTNGKSTTCAMIAHLFRKCGREYSLGGNFGDPVSAILARDELRNLLILELSSYQLELTQRLTATVAVFTSFSHDHLKRHGSLENYFKAKWRIFSNPAQGALAIMPEYIVQISNSFQLPPPEMRTVIIDPNNINKTLDMDPAGQKEKHNRLNALFSTLTVAHILNIDPKTLPPLLTDYFGLPHRCELIGTFCGYPIINDSKSTNVESTLAAIESQTSPVILLMGGVGKEESYKPLITQKSKIARLLTFGESGKFIHEELNNHIDVSENHRSLKDALHSLIGILKCKPQSVLFSPGCASFDEFRNFEQRGDFFRTIIDPILDKSKN